VEPLLVVFLPIFFTVAATGAIRAAAGPDRGARLSGAAVAIGFLAAWGFLLSPGWLPTSAFERIGHIVGGAALTGVVLDFLCPKRFWAAMAAGVVIIVSTWASLNNGLTSSETLTVTSAAALLALATLAFFFVARLDRMREQRAVSFVTVCMVALALAAHAAITGDGDLAVTALLLALAVGAFAVFQLIVPLLLGDSIILGAGAGLLAIAWALAERDPSARIGLILVPLILFAEGTARRIPLPAARVSTILYPLTLAGVAALPLGLGALITFVMYGP
jgi:hypothetical protein